jgi:hypothetical protein
LTIDLFSAILLAQRKEEKMSQWQILFDGVWIDCSSWTAAMQAIENRGWFSGVRLI